MELLWGSVCPVCERAVQPSVLLHPTCAARLPRSGPAARDLTPCWAHFEDGPEWFRVLHQWKYGGERRLARTVARHMAASPPPGVLRGVLAPMPDDPARRLSRGYSPVGDLARHLGELLQLRVDSSLLRRAGAVPSQTGCRTDEERRRNVGGAFRTGDLARWPAHQLIVLVDDQVTSGSTIAEAVPLLRARGAPVAVWCAARAARAPHGLP